jgi:putative SOS response-associated peptidase YedK
MCGRYRLSRRKQIIEEHFDAVSGGEDWEPSLRHRPDSTCTDHPANPKEPVRQLSLVRWGLISSWAKDMSGAASMINARSETAATKPAFRDGLKSRRCLVPAANILWSGGALGLAFCSRPSRLFGSESRAKDS